MRRQRRRSPTRKVTMKLRRKVRMTWSDMDPPNEQETEQDSKADMEPASKEKQTEEENLEDLTSVRHVRTEKNMLQFQCNSDGLRSIVFCFWVQ